MPPQLPCTGQKPHSSIMAALSPSSISPISYRIRVNPSLQISSVPVRPAGSRANTLEKLSALSLKPSSALTPPSSGETSENNSEHEDEDLSHMFAIGDVADTGAIQAGHTAHWQAEVAARNILRLIELGEGRSADVLETYKPGLPSIKVSLGLVRGPSRIAGFMPADREFVIENGSHGQRERCESLA